jgi:hypothetical protein
MSISLSGSLVITGSIVASGGITGSFSGSATTSSYALTASFVNPLTQSLSVSGSITATGILTAQTLVVQTITSSIVYSSGSNIFGNQLTDVQQMTGSVKITGSLSLNNIAIPTSASLASTYLPLTGGTLTGALSGTSATFSGVLTFANGVTNNIGSDKFFLGSGGYNYLYCRSTGLQILNQADTAALVTILNGGNVGIGPSSPGNYDGVSFTGPFLDVAGIMQIKGTSANTIAALQFGGSTYRKALVYSSVGTDDPYLALATASSGSSSSATERMRITSAGNVGIGTSTPTDFGATNTSLSINGRGGNAGLLDLQYNGTSGMFVYSDISGTTQYESRNLYLRFGTNNTERMMITSGGELQVAYSGGAGLIRSQATYTNTSANTPNMYVGSAYEFGRGTASSIRYKENITDWNESGIDTILALKPKTFTYKEEYYKHPERVILGLIAEEVAETCKYLADYENEDGSGQVENVRYAYIVVPLIKAIQEQQAMITSLQEQITELKNK